jgi:hypothetical protein
MHSDCYNIAIVLLAVMCHFTRRAMKNSNAFRLL